MNRDELLEKLEEIMDRNYQNFKGTNEAELMIREEIADLFRDEIQSRQAAVSGSLPPTCMNVQIYNGAAIPCPNKNCCEYCRQ